MHIGIAGNIGCGKTTLTRMLAEHYGWTPKFESVTYNPYLEDYYKDIERWSYNLETYFLAQRFQDLVEIAKSDDVIVQDRTILEGVHIFVANNKAMGNLSDRLPIALLFATKMCTPSRIVLSWMITSSDFAISRRSWKRCARK